MPIAKKTHLQSILALLPLLVLWMPCLGQRKIEREYRIKPNAVAASAAEFVSSTFQGAKVHWYAEESLDGKSIEAKLKYKRKHFSIEFDEAGRIQDIEIVRNKRQLDADASIKIENALNDTFKKYKIVKIQLQWKGSENNLKQAVLADSPTDGITVSYEIVLRGIKDKNDGYFEILLESNGAITRIREVVQPNADNLIY
jgi:hypothetical protein